MHGYEMSKIWRIPTLKLSVILEHDIRVVNVRNTKRFQRGEFEFLELLAEFRTLIEDLPRYLVFSHVLNVQTPPALGMR